MTMTKTMTLNECRQKYAAKKESNLDFFLKQHNQVLFMEREALLQECFPKIDLSFFSMIKDGLPAFAAYNANQSLSQVVVDFWSSFTEIHITQAAVSHESMQTYNFKEIVHTLANRNMIQPSSQSKVRLTHELQLLIPQKNRDIIHKLRTNYNVCVIAEADNWLVDQQQVKLPLISVDPLVVISYRKQYYLVDQFDLTTAENYVKSEFTV